MSLPFKELKIKEIPCLVSGGAEHLALSFALVSTLNLAGTRLSAQSSSRQGLGREERKKTKLYPLGRGETISCSSLCATFLDVFTQVHSFLNTSAFFPYFSLPVSPKTWLFVYDLQQ